jgi:16S rRNA (guanine(966)-N(2))-methyltransferase RsmD
MLAADGLVAEPDEPGARGPRVLDLYAGSGALSFEALSRGASEAVLVEHARDAVAAIRANATALGAHDRVRVLAARVERVLGQLDGPFDVIFADPPYADVPSPSFAKVLALAARLVCAGGALVLEHSSTDLPPRIDALQLDRSRRHGDTTLSLYRALVMDGPI